MAGGSPRCRYCCPLPAAARASSAARHAESNTPSTPAASTCVLPGAAALVACLNCAAGAGAAAGGFVGVRVARRRPGQPREAGHRLNASCSTPTHRLRRQQGLELRKELVVNCINVLLGHLRQL